MNNIRVSVAMAVYNGEKYIEEQINSILGMMQSNDEIIISYNASEDRTLDIIRKYEEGDHRIHVVYDDGQSVETNFNNAVKNCSGDYIFLCDQDDIWINDKVNQIVAYFEKHPKTAIVVSDGYFSDEELAIKGSIFETLHTSASRYRNFIKGTYLGCEMAFRKKIKAKVFPVPIVNPPVAHDLWLGVFGVSYGNLDLMEEKLIIHRMHKCNVSNSRKLNLYNMVKGRIMFFMLMIMRRMKQIILEKDRK